MVRRFLGLCRPAPARANTKPGQKRAARGERAEPITIFDPAGQGWARALYRRATPFDRLPSHRQPAEGWTMSRSSATALIATAVCVLVPLAAQAQDTGLPQAPGKEMVEGVCTGCHQTNMITQSSGYSREGWAELTGTMIDLTKSPQERGQILDYLAAHFPPNTRRAAKLVPGSVEVTFKEWQTPTLGQRTRDPIQAPDGSIWWAGQYGNLIGRLDPKTGEMREYPLPPNAKPHTVELDAN